MDNIQKFRELCASHDLTYTYSDDGKTYSRGDAQYKEIIELSKTMPRDVAVQIWNENVEKKIIQHSWNEFKWSI